MTVADTTLPFSLRGITGPCRPPYLCDTVVGTEAVSMTPELAAKGAKNVLVVLEDAVATAVRLPDDSNQLSAPSIVTIITGAAKARTSLCIGAADVCSSPDAVSLELPVSELSPAIAMPVRSLMAPRLEHAGGLRVTEAAAAQGSKPLTWFAPPDFGTRPVASILVVASEAVVSDAADANLGKIIVTLDGKKKDYVGHVTLNR